MVEGCAAGHHQPCRHAGCTQSLQGRRQHGQFLARVREAHEQPQQRLVRHAVGAAPGGEVEAFGRRQVGAHRQERELVGPEREDLAHAAQPVRHGQHHLGAAPARRHQAVALREAEGLYFQALVAAVVELMGDRHHLEPAAPQDRHELVDPDAEAPAIVQVRHVLKHDHVGLGLADAPQQGPEPTGPPVGLDGQHRHARINRGAGARDHRDVRAEFRDRQREPPREIADPTRNGRVGRAEDRDAHYSSTQAGSLSSWARPRSRS
ncbi:hypothetical protein D3C72_551940 [compost metagenome]